MPSYKEKFYSKYVSSHNTHLYGGASIETVTNQFSSWSSFYGRFLPEDKGVKIVDLGCGNGGLVHWLNALGFQDAHGVDVSKEQVEEGKRLGIKNLQEADIRIFLKDKHNYFDTIFLRDVLGHFTKEEILDVLDLVFVSVRPGGRVIVKTPNAESPLSGRLRYGDFTHDVSFTESSLRQVLLVAGFKKASVYPMRPAVHGLKSFIRRALWRCIELNIKFYRLIEAGSSSGIFTQNILAVAEK